MKDEDALICDFAEYYHVLSWRDLPVRTAATLAAGLRPCSRSYMKAVGVKADLTDSLLAMIHDRLADLISMLAGKNSKGISRIAEDVIHGKPEKSETEQYDAVYDFDAEWAKRTGKAGGE